MANSPDSGSEPINFRAALAAFEQQSTSSQHHAARSPTNRNNALPPHTPHRSASDPRDPVPRSSSTPRVRKNSDGFLSPSSNNPFSSPKLPSIAIPATSASGMLSAPSPAFRTSPSPQLTPVKKSDSGLSLNQLMNKSLPRGSVSDAPSAISKGRSKSIADGAASNGNSAPGSGRSTPSQRSGQGLFAPDDGNTLFNRTSSPSMLDQSTDTDQGPMFGHAIMQPGPSSPQRESVSLPPLQPNAARKGSASSTNSTNTPKLPPRPGSLAPSPTISEFGQFPNTSSTPKAKASTGPTNLGYATYTPGVKRHLGKGSSCDGSSAPPALPPRSATLGQSAERGRLDIPTYQTRQKSPMKQAPAIPKKPAKPVPPPRPGAAGGFRFGSGTYSTNKEGVKPAAPPPPRQRTLAAKAPTHQRNMSSAGSAGGLHRKTGSSVFTSISLSDDASVELKRSLDSDLHADHSALPPPSRGRPTPGTPLSLRPTPSTPSNTVVGGGVGVVSSLIGTAASALPLFKSSGASRSGGGLAEGAPSKQGYVGGASMRRSTSGPSSGGGMGDMGEAVWSSGRAVQLAEPAKGAARLREARDDQARQRYEQLFDAALARQSRRKAAKRESGAGNEGASSNASTIRGGDMADGQRRGSAGGVQALRGWFESDSSPAAASTHNDRATTQASSITPTNGPDRLSAKTVRKIWTRSKLSPTFLGQIWDQAVSFQSADDSSKDSRRGLGQEAFVRALASIDAELERKQKKKQARADRRRKREASARRAPPPPPPQAV